MRSCLLFARSPASAARLQIGSARLSLRVSARSLRSSRLPDGVVVLHRQSQSVRRTSLRLRTDLLPPGRSARCESIHLAHSRSLHGASGAQRSQRRSASITTSASIAPVPALQASIERTGTHLERQLAGPTRPRRRRLSVALAEQFRDSAQSCIPPSRPSFTAATESAVKPQGAGHASHYISFTRLARRREPFSSTARRYQVRRHVVDGSRVLFRMRWIPSECGWDWLSLQLDDNTELMLYRLRHQGRQRRSVFIGQLTSMRRAIATFFRCRISP